MRGGHQQRGDRIRRVFGSDDLGVVTRGLREQRAAALVGMLRAAVAMAARGHEAAARVRAFGRSFSAPLH